MRDAFIRRLLVETLELEGYATILLEPGESFAQEVRRHSPRLLVLEIGSHGENLAMLDMLRSIPETNRTAIITLGLNTELQVEAQASGNVQTALPMPFDLSDLLAAIKAAVRRRPAEARILDQPLEAGATYHRAADLLSRAEREVMLSWVQEARRVPPFAGRPDLTPQAFLDALPRILNLIVLALRHQEPPETLAIYNEVRERIEHHARERYRADLPIEATILEYHLLRETIRNRLRREMSAEDVLAVLGKLHGLLDTASSLSVAAYFRIALTTPPTTNQRIS